MKRYIKVAIFMSLLLACFMACTATADTSGFPKFNNVNYVEETITNNAGNEILLRYDRTIIWPDKEEEVLAYFLCQEGGNAEEKAILARMVVARLYDDGCPDTVKEVLCHAGQFQLSARAWNEWIDPSEEDIALARGILMSDKTAEYTRYIFKYEERVLGCLLPEEGTYETEHYIFYN